MHIIIPTIGSAGDVNPMIGLGQTLKDRGHRVTVMANPLHSATVSAAGLDFAPLGTVAEAEAVLNNPDLWHPQRGFQTIAQQAILPTVRPVYDFIAQHNPAETVVAAHSMAFGARLAQEKLGFSVATIHLQPSLIRSVYEAPITGLALPTWLPRPLKAAWWAFVDQVVIDRQLAEPLNKIRAELGLPPIRRIFQDWIHSPQRLLGLFPDWFAAPQPDWPPQTRLTGFPRYEAEGGAPLSPEVEAFLAAGPPPLVFTFGSAMLHGADFFKTAVAATQQMGQRALLVSRDSSQIPATLPQNVRHVPYAPFGDLLPRAALLIYHGGIGTLAQAVAAGIPHLVMPLSHDQPDNAARLERLGVGRSLPPARFQPSAVAEAVTALLSSPDVAARCRALASRMDAHAARQEAAILIEALGREPQQRHAQPNALAQGS